MFSTTKAFLLMILAMIFVITLSPFVFIARVIYMFFTKSLAVYFKTIALGFDQLGGSILYNKVNWTVSGYTGYLVSCNHIGGKVFAFFIDLFFGKGHCQRSYEWDSTYDALQELEEIDVL